MDKGTMKNKAYKTLIGQLFQIMGYLEKFSTLVEVNDTPIKK